MEPQRGSQDDGGPAWEVVQPPWPTVQPSTPLRDWTPPAPRPSTDGAHPSLPLTPWAAAPMPSPVPQPAPPGRRRSLLRGTALVVAGLAVGAAVGALSGMVVADDQDRVDQLSGQVDTLRDDVAGLEQQVDNTRAQAEKDVAAARTEAEQQVAQENADRQAELDARAAQLDAREADVKAREDAVTVLEQQAEDGSLPGSGVFLVGTEVAPGTYRATDPADCYWARLSGLSGDFSEIIANGIGAGSATVTIKASDKAFSSERCGSWQRIG